MGKLAFIFPGQGSQTVGMGQELAEQHSSVKAIFEKADEVLNRSLSSLIFNGPQDKLTLTVNTQPALVTTSVAILEYLNTFDIVPDYTAGHSLGEYSALVASGALAFEDAIQVVQKRAEYMEEAYPAGLGAMAAVLGMERELLKTITDEVTEKGDSVQLANINCQGQIVISGTKAGVEQAGELAKEKGARRVIPLAVSGPFHSRLMEPAANRLKDYLAEIEITQANIPVVANVTAEPVIDGGTIKNLLVQQLYSPVLWEDSVKKMIELGVDTFIEIGPGKVLTGLVRKIDRSVKVLPVYDEETLQAAVSSLKGE